MDWTAFIPAFLSSFVEFVEALTIVLAVGVSTNWKTSLAGAAAAVALLVVLVGVLGLGITSVVPLGTLRLVVGVFLILFGAQWLRKGLYRASGLLPQRDEDLLYRRQVGQGGGSQVRQPGRFHGYGFATAFKSVLLEGLEVAFIVVTLGTAGNSLHSLQFWSASSGALAALGLVILLGVLVHRPLTKIPENTLKLVVGLMLVTYGVFWAGEGVGLEWPLGDGFLLVLALVWAAIGFGLYHFLVWKRLCGARVLTVMEKPRSLVLRVLYEVYDFCSGDWFMVAGTFLTLLNCLVFSFKETLLLFGLGSTFILTVLRPLREGEEGAGK